MFFMPDFQTHVKEIFSQQSMEAITYFVCLFYFPNITLAHAILISVIYVPRFFVCFYFQYNG